MNKKARALICDQILDKFRGNKSFSWDQIHEENFYLSIHSGYFEVENLLNYLLGDGIKELELYVDNDVTYVRLSRKGIYTISDLKTEGYVARWKTKRRELIWKFLLGAISVTTFILVAVRAYRDFSHGIVPNQP